MSSGSRQTATKHQTSTREWRTQPRQEKGRLVFKPLSLELDAKPQTRYEPHGIIAAGQKTGSQDVIHGG